jgi:hypothetical protein
MPIILVIDKLGNMKEVSIKSYNEEDLYKKAGFKVTEGFHCHTKWTVKIEEKTYNILLYAKSKGKNGQENKYDFPPPVDRTIFFGSCLLFNTTDDNVAEDLRESEWKTIYEKLFVGFEDIGSQDSEEEDVSEDSEYDDCERTRDGYLKDGFVVEDDEKCHKKMKKSQQKNIATKMTTVTTKSKQNKTVFEMIEQLPENNVNELNCTTELVEEEYL